MVLNRRCPPRQCLAREFWQMPPPSGCDWSFQRRRIEFFSLFFSLFAKYWRQRAAFFFSHSLAACYGKNRPDNRRSHEIQRCWVCPDTNAGASERAGFIEAPVIGPANIASNNTTALMAMPAVIPFSFEPVEILMITSISKNVRMISSMNDCIGGPAGRVVPRVGGAGKSILKIPLAANAPIIWLAI